MASRPIFVPSPDDPALVRTVPLTFAWSPGLAASQKKKNIQALHQAAEAQGCTPVLEISTKAESVLGQHMSAFHLRVSGDGQSISLESAFQGSKVFEHGGPYRDLYRLEAREAKRDPRLRQSGGIIAFEFGGVRFPTKPTTVFYDWLYVNALFDHREWLRPRLGTYMAFSDIEFNPQRSQNCQARSCALFVALDSKRLLETAVQSPRHFIRSVSET